jgi:hypothetical protein
VALVLSVLIWIIATTGGQEIFVKEVLGDAFDSQAEHFLRGNIDVDADAIRWETMIVNGKTRMYFGPFPALLRIPLNFVYPAGRGEWSRISGFLAGELALFAFTGLISTALSRSALCVRARNWLGGACLIGFVFGTPLLSLLGNLSIYSEAIIWGFAWSVAALFFLWRCRSAEGIAFTLSLAGFSVCAALALFSRATFGAALVIIAPLVALQIPREKRLLNFTVLGATLGLALASYLLLNYAKLGNLTGANYESYINSPHREFAREHGTFNLSRVPYSFADYFSLVPPSFHLHPPFVRVDRHPVVHPGVFSLPVSETFISIPWCSSWLAVTATVGIAFLCWRTRTDYFQRWIAAAFFAQAVCVLSYLALAERYTVEFYPLLISCLFVFLSAGRTLLVRMRHAVIGLIIVSSAINLLATAYYLASDSNLPVETRNFWSAISGKDAVR